MQLKKLAQIAFIVGCLLAGRVLAQRLDGGVRLDGVTQGLPFGGQLTGPLGSCPTPAYSFAGNPSWGFGMNAPGTALQLCTNAGANVQILAGTFQVNDENIVWAAGATGKFAISKDGSTDGHAILTNGTATSGVGFDLTADNVFAIRSRAFANTTKLDVSIVQTSNAFITTGTGLTVANVGANSCGTSAATIAGASNAFVITVGATSGTQCRVAFPLTAVTEWDCASTDATTLTTTRAVPVDTTHTDFFGTFTAGDKVTGICFAR